LYFQRQFITTANANEKYAGIVGVWKSNEVKTLKSINTKSGITLKARKLLEGDFFGHLIVEFRENTSRAYWDKEENNTEDMLKFYPYILIEVTEKYFLVDSYDFLEDKMITKKLFRDGNCYYITVTK
jgi:hypothetical protein